MSGNLVVGIPANKTPIVSSTLCKCASCPRTIYLSDRILAEDPTLVPICMECVRAKGNIKLELHPRFVQAMVRDTGTPVPSDDLLNWLRERFMK